MAYIPQSLTASAAVTASGTITTQNSVPAGTATAGSAVEITLNGLSGLTVQISGTYTGALSLQVTTNGTTWVTAAGLPINQVGTTAQYLAAIASASTGIYQVNVGGFLKARFTALAAVTGTATLSMQAVAAPTGLFLAGALPSGGNTIGTVAATMAANATSSPAKAQDAVAGASDTGIPTLGKRIDTLAVVTPAVGDYVFANFDSYGRQYVNNQTVTILNPGFLIFQTTALTNVAQQIKASTGNIFGYNFINVNTIPIYVKLYGVPSASVTVGTTLPSRIILVPAGDAVNPGCVLLSNDESAFFNGATGLSFFATSVLASATTQTAPTTPIYAEAIYV